MRVPSTTMFRSSFAGSMLALMLLMALTVGVNAGITADNKAEIRTQFDEARDIDFEEVEEPNNPAVPDQYEQRLDEFENAIPSPMPESLERAIEERVQSFAKMVALQMFALAEGVAIFAFNHQNIVGHPVVVMLTEGAISLAILGVIGWNVLRVFRLYRGVEG